MKLLSDIVATISIMLMSFTPIVGYKPGDAVTDFSLQNVDGKMVSMAQYKNAKGFIVVFTCNHCPFAKLYQERLNIMNKEYGRKGFHVLAISSNDADAVPEDNFEAMQQRAREQKYNFPYLYDKTQEVARAFGAYKTPHAFVLFREGGKWIVKYSGAIDDNGKEPEKVTNKFVENAIDALLHGQPVAVTTTKSVGCAIKWK